MAAKRYVEVVIPDAEFISQAISNFQGFAKE